MTTPTIEDFEALITADRVAPLKDLTRERWLDLRVEGLGGSDASAVLGWNQYTTPLRLYLEKTGLHRSPDGAGEAAYWGVVLEDLVANRTEEKFGLTIVKPEYLYRSADWPFMLGNPDRLAWDPDSKTFGVYEGKTAGLFVADQWEDGPAVHALIQANHYMSVLGPAFQWARISVLIAGQRFESFHVERDEEVIDMLIKAEARFWEMVEHRIEPAPMHFSSEKDLLGELWPKAKALTEKLMPPDASVLTVRREELRLQIKDLEAEKDTIENQLRLWIEDAELGKAPDGTVLFTYKSIPNTRLDEGLLNERYPEVAADCRPEGRTMRRFHFPKPKKGKK